jgi:hypothetical protein
VADSQSLVFNADGEPSVGYDSVVEDKVPLGFEVCLSYYLNCMTSLITLLKYLLKGMPLPRRQPSLQPST